MKSLSYDSIWVFQVHRWRRVESEVVKFKNTFVLLFTCCKLSDCLNTSKRRGGKCHVKSAERSEGQEEVECHVKCSERRRNVWKWGTEEEVECHVRCSDEKKCMEVRNRRGGGVSCQMFRKEKKCMESEGEKIAKYWLNFAEELNVGID